MSAQHKICPRCKQPALLDAAFCAGCGRQYRTNFAATNDQTMLGTSGAPPPPAAPQYAPPAYVPPVVPNYTPTSAVGGPLDNTERNVSMTWTGVGLVMTALVFLGSVRYLVEYLLKRDGAEQFGYSLLYLVFWGWLLSFLQMRLRRLYLTAPDGAPAADILQRRRRFAAISTAVFFALVVTGVGLAGARVWDERVAEARLAETKRAEAQAEQLRLQAQTAEREREIQLSREHQAEWEARRAAEREREVQLSRERQAEWEARRGAVYQPSSAPRPGQPDWSNSYRAPTSAPSLRRVTAPQREAVDPNAMPCGHAFARFISTQAGGETGICTQGHQYRMRAGRWTPIGAAGSKVPPSTILPATPGVVAPIVVSAPVQPPRPVPPSARTGAGNVMGGGLGGGGLGGARGAKMNFGGTTEVVTKLPCGHELAEVTNASGLGGGHEARCIRGHRFVDTSGNWRAINL